ncbi:DUF397 domain-containing protein [Actinoplanes sp. ATCC 53533]|uniref:DUF397 domain-containing protein n=1 Tax=Actinoplanes sp. ATCC 53533 TaxID=1288362 RepID=UPI000F7A5E3C|nr:DUF397 domain-containing protein [Actinoplanes sp. ATCC 53533]RSM55613.1 DUF397 domain-containing protein [Actinoplanes sp. ATCC 53533]
MEPVKWFKSTRSGNNGSCVEVAKLGDDAVGVRDTKAHGNGPILTFTRAEWDAFIGGAKDGEFDLT